MGLEDYLNIFQMSEEILFGLKVIALVMLYGYMHMNLGGGILATAVFSIFGYYMLFHMGGVLSLVVLVLFFLMLHGFDILWGGDIAKGQFAERAQARQMRAEPHMAPHPPPVYHVRPPPP